MEALLAESQKGVEPAGVDIWNLCELQPVEELVMSKHFNYRSGQGAVAMNTLGWGGMRPMAGAAEAVGFAAFPQVRIEDVKDYCCSLITEIAEKQTLEA